MSNFPQDFTHLKEDGAVTMVGTGTKVPVRRVATACCFLKMAASTVEALRKKALPKGDALVVAKVAGIQAAKWTSHLIPLCHSLEARHIDVDCVVEESGVRIQATVETVAPTGPEMEALTAATVAGLALYDVCKAVDKGMILEDVHLVSKSGGKSSIKSEEMVGRSVAILTLSDRLSGLTPDGTGSYQDQSGPLAESLFRQAGLAVIHREIIPDEKELLIRRLKQVIEDLAPDLVVTLGSTGLSPRDIAPEATKSVIDRTVPGLPEAIRTQFFPQHPTASFLSRGIAGLCGKTLIVNLPGRPSAVQEGLSILIPSLSHVFKMLEGAGHEEPEKTPKR